MNYQQSIYNEDFYPTPTDVIEKMLSLTDIKNKIILEPSAGKGNIVNYLKEHGAKEVIACEKDRLLIPILKEKCEIIADDFLTVTPEQVSHIDLIVMNPPFSNEERHILHAYEIAPEGCEIISLCNYQMLNNSYSENRRKIKELIENFGSDEYYGDVFKRATERRTDVGISCIRIYKPQTRENEFEGIFDLNEEDETNWNGEGQIIRHDYAREMVGRYKQAMECFDEVTEANERINKYCKALGSETIKFGAKRTNDGIYGFETEINRDKFKKQLQKDAWRSVFNNFNMEKYVTKNIYKELDRAIEITTNLPFTVKNIYRLVQMIVATHEERMKRVIVETFEKICSYSAENSTAGEKWKTNSDYMVNRKFIVPYIVTTRFYDEYVDVKYENDIEDLIKALCYISATDYSNIDTLYNFCYMKRPEFGKWYSWGFFRIKGYKKGTMHFEFINEDLWYKFNQTVAEIKGWRLPKTYNKNNRKKN